MTIKQFISGKDLQEVHTTFDRIFTLVVDGVPYAVELDPEQKPDVPSGTVLDVNTDFLLEGDILTVSGFSVDISTTNMLGMSEDLLM